MPQTAQKIIEFGGALPDQLTGSQLDAVVDCLKSDLPGAVEFIARAATQARDEGTFTYVSQAPAEMSTTEEWNKLVGFLSRLFASPFVAIVREWSQRRYGVDIAFVNCCIVAAQPGTVDDDELWCLQTNMQLTPDC